MKRKKWTEKSEALWYAEDAVYNLECELESLKRKVKEFNRILKMKKVSKVRLEILTEDVEKIIERVADE